MALTENAIKVLEKRYLAKGENGELMEEPEEMFLRVAKAVANGDKEHLSSDEIIKVEKEFYDMMYDLEFLPNSPTLMNAGRSIGQLSACFVLPIEDCMEGIFESIKNAALIHKSGGGTGFSFSKLRPKGSTVNSTGGVASGPISFMKVFNAATEAVKQGGTRRGANMGILRVDHPDILEFISSKKDNSEITNFNISVGITEKFMNALKAEKDYELIEPHTKSITGVLNARKVFDLIVDMAWKNGEPGIIFLDRLNQDNPTPQLGEIESTNPCGEQPLLPYEACNLGSINLSLMVKEIEEIIVVDYEKLANTVRKAVHFLDNVIDVNNYPLPEIDKMTRGTRKIGLGVMGWADMLIKLGISYNSSEALKLAEEVMSFIGEEARKESCEIAKLKGVFPYYEKSVFMEKGLKIRNATLTTIAPTGTLSIIAGVSSGVEPLFAVSYIRNVMDSEELLEVHPVFKEIAMKRGFYSESLMKRIAQKGTIQGFDEIPIDVRKIFVTSHDITPNWHIGMQSAFQKYTDNAVSKTVNLRQEATKNDVREVFVQAYEKGCKGVTIYRDNSRDMQVLNIGKVKGKTVLESPNEVKHIQPRPRPDVISGLTEKVKIGCGNLYITVNYDENGISEVFTNLGRAGGCPSQSEATSRLISIALRSGIEAKTIVEQLKGIRCLSTIRQKGLKVKSCPDAIGTVIEKVMNMNNFPSAQGSEGKDSLQKNLYIREDDLIKEYVNLPEIDHDEDEKGICPECGRLVEHESGCIVCRYCGFSKCG
ncbi:MAG: vitamin B12-dependent ribonucleotide reductase [Eubacteriales bacterium]